MGSKVVITIKKQSVASKIGNGLLKLYTLGWIRSLFRRNKVDKNMLGVILDDNELELDIRKKTFTFDVEPGEHAIAARDPQFESKHSGKATLKALGSFAGGVMMGGGSFAGVVEGVNAAADSTSKSLANRLGEEWNSAIFQVADNMTQNVTLKLTAGGKVKIKF